jgi:NTP pyrophosphatase (non-canonical NTP hydrolase)
MAEGYDQTPDAPDASKSVPEALAEIHQTMHSHLRQVAESARKEGRHLGYRLAVSDVVTILQDAQEQVERTDVSVDTVVFLGGLCDRVKGLHPTVYGSEKPKAQPPAEPPTALAAELGKREFTDDEIDEMIDGKSPMTVMGYVAGVLRTENINFDSIRARLDNPMIRLLHAMLGMASELGELAEPIKKFVFYGKPIDWNNIWEELGDENWYMGVLSDVIHEKTGVNLPEVLRRNLAKLRKRYKKGFDESAAMHRNLDAEKAALEGKVECTVCGKACDPAADGEHRCTEHADTPTEEEPEAQPDTPPGPPRPPGDNSGDVA